MADITCGQGGSTGQEIVDRINFLSRLNPRASMRITDTAIQPISDDAEPKVLTECFDATVTQRGGLAANHNAASITNNTGSDFSSAILSVGLNIALAANNTLEVYVFVNGVSYSNHPITITGEGVGSPIDTFWQSDIAIEAGDIVDIRGRNADIGLYDLSVFRSTMRLDVDNRELLEL